MQIRDVAPMGDDEGRGGGCAHGGDGGADARENPAPSTGDDDRRPGILKTSGGIYGEKFKFPDEPVRSPGGRIIKRHPWKTAWSTGAWRRPPPSAPRGATPASTPADDEPAGATMEDRGGEREPAIASPSPSRSPSPASLVGRLAARRRRRAATPSDSEPVMSFESESNSDRSDAENESDLELANAPGLDFLRSAGPPSDSPSPPASQSRRKRRRRISRTTHVEPMGDEDKSAREEPPGDENRTDGEEEAEDANEPEAEEAAADARASQLSVEPLPPPRMATADDDDDEEDDEPVPDSDEDPPDDAAAAAADDDDDPAPLSSPGLGTAASPVDLTQTADEDDDDDDVLETPADPPTAHADSNLWACAACTFLNQPDLETCEMCERSRPVRATSRVESEVRPTGRRTDGTSRRRRLVESDDDGDDDAGAEADAEADAEPTYGCSRCRFSRNGCYDSFDWSGRNGGRGCRPDAWRGPSQYHVDGEVAATSPGGIEPATSPTATGERGPKPPGRARTPASRRRVNTDGGGAVGGKRARGGQQITPGSGSAGRAARRGALPLVESGGGGGRGASRRVREEPRGKEKDEDEDEEEDEEEEEEDGGEIVISDSEDISEDSEDVSEEEDEVETDSDPDADDPYARGLPTPATAPRPKRQPKSPKRPRYNDVGERVDSGDDLEDESDFEGYDDDMFERAMGGGGGGGARGGRGGSSSGGKGRWFTKNGRRVYKVGGREFTGGAAMAWYRRDGGSTGATGGTRRRKTTRKKKGTARRKTTRKKTTRKAKAKA